MAKGDKKKVETAIDYQGRLAQEQLTRTNQQVDTSARTANDIMYGPQGNYQPPPPTAPTPTPPARPRGNLPAGKNSRSQDFPETMWNAGSTTSGETTTGGGDTTGGTAQSIIAKWQQTHDPGEPLDGLIAELKRNGINADFFKRGDAVSGNEISLNGEQYKVKTGDNRSWWDPSMGEGGEGGGFGEGIGGVAGQQIRDYGEIMGRYREFAETGGFSPEDLANMRARGISPVRAAYANAEREVQRGRALQGGYSPNATAVQAKMAREMGQGTADAAQNVEANLAQMVQQGRFGGMGGMASMYGSTPGMAATFGNQALAARNQQLQGADLQSRLGLGLIGAQLQATGVPGNYGQALNNIGGTIDLVGKAGNAIGSFYGAPYNAGGEPAPNTSGSMRGGAGFDPYPAPAGSMRGGSGFDPYPAGKGPYAG